MIVFNFILLHNQHNNIDQLIFQNAIKRQQ